MTKYDSQEYGNWVYGINYASYVMPIAVESAAVPPRSSQNPTCFPFHHTSSILTFAPLSLMHYVVMCKDDSRDEAHLQHFRSTQDLPVCV